MTILKSLLVAALLGTFAAVSFAQAPAAPVGPEHGAVQPHHHKHHRHHHHHHRHHGQHGMKANGGR